MDRKQTSRLSIKDVARAANTAVSTVSRALNGRPDVSEETRQRIVAIAQEMGFEQNSFARSLIHGRSGLVAVIGMDLESDYPLQLLRGAVKAARQRSLEVLLTFADLEGYAYPICSSLWKRGITDGAVVISPRAAEEARLQQLQQQGFGIVIINPTERLPGVSSIEPSDFVGAFDATQHLLALGHRRIAAITAATNFSFGRERLAGYEAALRQAGIAPDPQLVTLADYSVESGVRQAVQELLDRDVPFTGVVCFNDHVASELLHTLIGHGRRVPEDVSVVGFDDLPMARYIGSGLTTVRQPIEEIGAQALQMLADVNNGVVSPGERRQIATSLVIRGSSAPPARTNHG